MRPVATIAAKFKALELLAAAGLLDRLVGGPEAGGVERPEVPSRSSC